MKSTSSRLPHACRAVTMTMADTPHIEGRLRALLNDRSPRHTARGALLGAIAGAVVLSIPLAALRPAPAQTPTPPSTVTQEQLVQIEAQLKRIEEQLSRLKATSGDASSNAQADHQSQVDMARQAMMQAEERRKAMEIQLRDRDAARKKAMVERNLTEVYLRELQLKRRDLEMHQKSVENTLLRRGGEVGGISRDPSLLALRDQKRILEIQITAAEEQLKNALQRSAELESLIRTEQVKP